MATQIQSIIVWTDTRDALPEHFQYVLFCTADRRIHYGMWEQNHRRFYKPGGHYDLADVRSWAAIPTELPSQPVVESTVNH
jgi:hypothetical protein